MTYQLDIGPEALADLESAGDWYEQQRPGLGADFLRAIRQTINALPTHPLIYSVREHRRRIRWVIPPRFPYRIVYRVKGDRIAILAVVHAARQDSAWRRRA